MEKRVLGSSDLELAPLAFGGNVFGWTVDEPAAFSLLDAFVGEGFNFIDTADVYPRWVPGNKGGESEVIIGNWMKDRGTRNKVIIATKVGGDMGQGDKDISKKYILRAAEDSLRRLQVETIDLYQTHWDVETVPVEETLEAYAQLVQEGKIRWIGASNISAARLKTSLEASDREGYPRYQSVQPLYNLYDREAYEKELEPLCMEQRLGVLCYYSLASGFLTGKYRSVNDLKKSQRGQGVSKYLNERGLRILEALDKVAALHRSSVATVALAWVIARPSVTAPIASATTVEQLKELTSAATLQLSKEDIERLNAASAY